MPGGIRFYLDEHVARAVAEGLRQRGMDVVMVKEAGLRGASDLEQLTWASQESRVVCTQDADFLRLHTHGHTHAGIVYAAQGTPVGQIIRGLLLVFEVLRPEEMVGHVEFL